MADLVAYLNTGAQVEILEDLGDWYKVSHNGSTGYLFASYGAFRRRLLTGQSPLQPDGGDIHRGIETVLFAALDHRGNWPEMARWPRCFFACGPFFVQTIQKKQLHFGLFNGVRSGGKFFLLEW